MNQKKKTSYDQIVSYQEDNHEEKGKVENQNQHHNVKKEALGKNVQR